MHGSSNPALGPGAPGGLWAAFRSWRKARSSRIGQESARGETGRPQPHCHASVRVLVVDDNPVNLMVVSALMEVRGLVPVLAADGAEAVALACELDFDLILMDLQMPILGGLAATSAIRRFETDNLLPAVPVVVYSSMSPSAAVLAAHGMSGSLPKPCGDQDLEECLLRWCPAYRPAPAVRGVAGGRGS